MNDDTNGHEQATVVDDLATLEEKLQLIRDRTRGVAEGYANGLYLWGEGGTSKSYTVEETLKSIKKPYKLSNSRLTAKGLFELLDEHTDVVHVLEDVETLLDDKNAAGVLRSAMWGQEGKDGRQERRVTWHIAGKRREVIFTGGIVMVANCPMDDLPQLRALKTRIPCVRYQATQEEVAALMRKIARQGHRHGEYWLPPESCLEVAEEVIARSQRVQRNLDLRLLVNTCKDRLQWENGAAETHWLDLLESRLRERVLPAGKQNGSRATRKENELALVRGIAHMPPEDRLRAWQSQTNKSQAALYRRLAELNNCDSHFSPDTAA